MDASESGGGAGRVTRFLRDARTGLFGTLFVIQKKAHASTARSVISSVIRFAQVISFLISPYAFKGWHESTISVVRFILGLPTVHGYWSFFTVDAYLAMYYASLVWVGLFLGLTVWAANGFVKNNFSALWPLKLLRAIGTLSGSILFIPLFTLLMSNYQCGMPHLNKMMYKSGLYKCYSGGHLAQSVVAGVLAVAFVALCSMFALVFYDSSPLSSNIVAKAHGRVDFIFLMLKILLVITVETFPTEIPTWLLVALLVACAATWTAAMLYFLPFYDARWNAWTTAQASMFLYGAFCLAVSEWYPEHDAAVTLYLGIGLAGAVGAYLTHARQSYILRTPAIRLSSPYEIELKARLMLHQAIWGHPTDRSGQRGLAESPTAAAGQGGDHGHGHDGALEEAEGSDDMEQRLIAARRLIPVSLLAEVQALYRQSASRFRSSAIMHVFFSRFYNLTGNRHMQMSHLLQAERRHPPLDVAFVVFQARKLAEDDTGSGGQLNAISRVAFEKHSADARKLVQRAALRQLAFWQELLDSQPDVSRLHDLSSEMGTAIEMAEAAFTELFQLNPQSVSTLRLYAAFNHYTLANPDRAGVLLAEAERIEDQKSRDHRAEGGASSGSLVIMSESNLDVMADNTAVATIGATQRNFGIVNTANSATSKLFGYSRLQLERRFFFTLLPEPLAGLWESMVRTYVATGEGKIASTHVVFGLNRSAFITPMLLCMRETPADEGPPGFIVLMRELARAHENYILMTSDFAITAASAGALQDLSIDPSSLGSHEVSITDFVLEWEAPGVQTELRSNRGTTLCIDARAAHKTMGNKLGSMDDDVTAVLAMDTEGEDTILTPGTLITMPTPAEVGAPRVFVRASMHAVSLKPPRDDRLGMEATATGAYAGPHAGHLGGQAHTPGPRGAAREGKPGKLSSVGGGDRAAGAAGAVDGTDGGSVSFFEAPADVCYVLTYTRVAESDTYTLAKAGKKRRDSLLAMHMVTARGKATGAVPAKAGAAVAMGPIAAAGISSFPAAAGPRGGVHPAGSAVSSDPHSRAEGSAHSLAGVPRSTITGLPNAVEQAGGAGGQQVRVSDMEAEEGGSGAEEDDDNASMEAAGRDGDREPLVAAGAGAGPVGGEPRLVIGNADVLTTDSAGALSSPVHGRLSRGAGSETAAGATGVDSARTSENTAPPALSLRAASKGGRTQYGQPQRGGPGMTLQSPGMGQTGGPGSSKMRTPKPPSFRANTGGRLYTNASNAGPRRLASARGHDDSDDEDEEDEDGKRGMSGKRSVVDGRTVVDRESQGSGTSYGRRVINRLRRVLADSNAHLSKGLLALRAAGIFVMVLSVALAVAAAVVLDGQFSDYRSNLLYTDYGSHRILNLFTSITHVQNLVFRARGWLPNDAASVRANRDALKGTASEFVATHRIMYQMIQGTYKAVTYTDAAKYPIVLTEYDTPEAAGTNVGSYRTVNLFQAGLAMAAAFQSIADAPLANLTDDAYPPVMFILTNGLPGGIAHERLHESSLEVGYTMSVAAKDSVRLTALYVYISISGVLAAVGLIVFTPILLNIEGSKDAIVKRFVFLPPLVKVNLQKQAEKRMQELRRNFNDSDDDDDGDNDSLGDDDDGDGPTSARSGMPAAVMPADGGMAAAAADMDDGEDINWDMVLAAVKAADAKKKARDAMKGQSASKVKGWKKVYAQAKAIVTGKGESKAYKKSYRSVLLLFGKFLGPLLALFLFFTAVFIVSDQTLGQTLKLSSAQVAAAYRTACTRESIMDVARALMARHDRDFFLIQLSAAKDTVDCVRYHQQLLMFGAGAEEERGEYAGATVVMETGKQSLLSDEANRQIYDAQFSNACPFIAKLSEVGTTVAECDAFDGGIMHQGLATVVTEFIRRANLVLDRRQRARVVEGTTDGWVVPVRSYPYANDTCGDGGCWDYSDVSGEERSPAPDLSVLGEVPVGWDHASWNAEPWSMAEDVTSDDMNWLRAADRRFLEPALNAIQDMYNDAGFLTIDRYRSFLGIFVGVFVASFIVFMTVVFLPQVRALHNELQKKRSMLLFLPPQVIKSVPSIRQLVDEILAADNTGMGRSAGAALRANATLRAAQLDEHAENRKKAASGNNEVAVAVGGSRDGPLLPVSPPMDRTGSLTRIKAMDAAV